MDGCRRRRYCRVFPVFNQSSRLTVSDRIFLPEMTGRDELEVSGSEAHHLLHVLRVSVGTSLDAFDGQGLTASATVIAKGRKNLRVALSGQRIEQPLAPIELTVLAALPKGDRIRFLVEKLTEIGVHRLIPLVTARSNARSLARSTGSHSEKLDRYVVEACKQCGRNHLMIVNDDREVSSMPEITGQFDQSILLDPRATTSLATGFSVSVRTAAICVGPEGGWTESETDTLANSGWMPFRLGWNVLRTETAAIAGASIALELASSRRPMQTPGDTLPGI